MDALLDWAWLIVALPLVSAGVLAIAGRRLKEPLGGLAATGVVGLSFLLTVGCFIALLGRSGEERLFTNSLYEWMPVGGFQVDAAYRIDPLTVTLMLLITGVGSLIHIYAIGYMHGDERFTTFFSYLNLFVGSMLVLVMAQNFLVLFVGWELVGACSFLLIGFWWQDLANSTAAKKAFIVNRIGDVGFMIAMFFIFFTCGSLDFDVVFGAANAGVISAALATGICLLLLVGATGKSAQIPLYLWLPDAMAGPTPVSALIHAATMVTAGVYLIAVCAPLFQLSESARFIVALIGVLTALVAGIVGLGQWKLKKVLAYSTISQIGYMIAAVGVGGVGYSAGIFHLLSHGFFKALLFLCAGSVMHGMNDEEDMRKLGGLYRHMPITATTYLIVVPSISGIFPLVGFWSKDAVLASLFETHAIPGGKILWGIGLAAAFITALYMFRQFFMTFTGEPRWDEDVHPHESPAVMYLPLVALAGLVIFGGVIDLPGTGFLHAFLEPVFGAAGGETPGWTAETFALLGVSLAVAVTGVLLARVLWSKTSSDRLAAVADRLEPATTFVRRAYYVDEATQAAVEKPGWALTGALETVDQKGIDAAAVGIGAGVRRMGAALSTGQSGYVRTYAGVILVGVVILFVYVLMRVGFGL